MNDIHGKLPEDWKLKTIDDLSVRVGSGVTPRGGSEVYTHEGVLFIRSQNVRFNGLDLGDVAYIDQKTHDSMQASEIFPQDVLFNITGASIGRCCIVPDGIGSANVNQHVCAIRLSDPTTSDARYLSIVLSSSIGQDQVLRFNAGGNREGLNYQQLRSFQIPWPPRAQRKVIAEILSTVDRAIEQTEAAIAKQQRIKTGLMQDLLTRGIDEHGNLRSEQTHHFKDSPLGRIPVEWEVECLEKLTKRIVDGVHHTPTYVDSGIPFIVVTDLTAGPGIDFSRTRFVTEYDHRQFSKRADPHPGDVLVTKDGTLGVARVVEEGTTEFSIFVSVAMLRPHLDICLPELIWSFFDSGQFLLQLGALSAGTGLAHIHLEHFRKFLLRIPPIIEQERIFRIVNKHKERLKNLKENMNKQKAIKTALTQDLLTGKKRVTSLLE